MSKSRTHATRNPCVSRASTVFIVPSHEYGAGGTFGDGSNETIFKYSVTLLDNIEFIRTRSAQEREGVLRAFTSRGIRHLPDGRRIESVVL